MHTHTHHAQSDEYEYEYEIVQFWKPRGMIEVLYRLMTALKFVKYRCWETESSSNSMGEIPSAPTLYK